MFLSLSVLSINALFNYDALMQDMVPGLAIEEFSTPPSSPVLATRTRRKTALSLPTTDHNSAVYKPTRDSSNNLQDMQLGCYFYN